MQTKMKRNSDLRKYWIVDLGQDDMPHGYIVARSQYDAVRLFMAKQGIEGTPVRVNQSREEIPTARIELDNGGLGAAYFDIVTDDSVEVEEVKTKRFI